jgi:hypothetical protein
LNSVIQNLTQAKIWVKMSGCIWILVSVPLDLIREVEYDENKKDYVICYLIKAIV